MVLFFVQRSGCTSHSLISSHTLPLRLYPFSQVQVKLPTVFLQVAVWSQSCVPVLHSSISSSHVVPFQPGAQVHLNDATSSVQVAPFLHGVPILHSSISVQLLSSP